MAAQEIPKFALTKGSMKRWLNLLPEFFTIRWRYKRSMDRRISALFQDTDTTKRAVDEDAEDPGNRRLVAGVSAGVALGGAVGAMVGALARDAAAF
jgi:hypothetical protein